MKQKEFDLEKELLELKHKHVLEKHKLRMEELAYIRENNRISHEQALEHGRIKAAEIRKNLERKANMRFMNDYNK